MEGSVYLCPVCRHPGKSPIVNKNTYTTNGHLGMEQDPTFDDNSQDSMSLTSETDDMAGRSLTPLSSHNSPGSSSLESIYTAMPKKNRMGPGPGKLGARQNSRKLPKLLSSEGPYQVENNLSLLDPLGSLYAPKTNGF
eukprot:sb/3474467/